MSKSATVVDVAGLSLRFQEAGAARVLLDDVSLRLEPGSMTALQGPSGCGKSTLLEIIAGIQAPDRGTVSVGGETMDARDPRVAASLRRRRLGLVSQQLGLIEEERVGDNVGLPLLYGKPRSPAAERRRLSADAVAAVGLNVPLSTRVRRLSGGEKQRVAIARALVHRPEVLLADEPTSALDPTTGGTVMDVLRETARAGTAVLLTTHDPQVAARCDRVLRLERGQLIPAGAGLP